MNDINWREELLDSTKFNQTEEKLLKDGPKSLTDSSFLSALYTLGKDERLPRNSYT